MDSSGEDQIQPEIELNAAFNLISDQDCVYGEFSSILASPLGLILLDHLVGMYHAGDNDSREK